MAKKKAWRAWVADATGIWPFLAPLLALFWLDGWLTVAELTAPVTRDVSWHDIRPVAPVVGMVGWFVLYLYDQFHRRKWLCWLGQVIAFYWLSFNSFVLFVGMVFFTDTVMSDYGALHPPIESQWNWLQVTVVGGLHIAAWICFWRMKGAENGKSTRELKKAKEAEEAKNAKKAAKKAAKEAQEAEGGA